MCGISGLIVDKKIDIKNKINKTLSLMSRRGPDAQKFTDFKFTNKYLALLHSRLSIIDLKDRSNQPMTFNGYTIIFNGEIYNYKEIKNDLIKKGYKFKTNSDTEVLLKSYVEYGEECVHHFIGMWAIAIWDNKKKQLFLSRDIFGEKPLYYFKNQNSFYFGSEIKFIQSLLGKSLEINYDLIAQNLSFGHKCIFKNKDNFYKNIYRLEPGHNLILSFDFKLKTNKFWTPKININNKMSYSDAKEGTIFYLKKSLSYRLRSDVPVAFCLSGGIDSTLLASLTKKVFKKSLTSFSIIDSDQRYNESKNIQIINKDLNTKNYLVNLKDYKSNFIDNLKEINNYHDSPISTLSYYIHYLLTKKIKDQKFKVSISGVGADEIFSGYYYHYLHYFKSIKDTNILESSINNWKKYNLKNIKNKNFKDPYFYIKKPNDRKFIFENNQKYLKKKLGQKFSETHFTDDLLRNRMLNELICEIVPVILKHDDLNSMYNSIENRSPFLDKDLFEFSMQIPTKYLMSGQHQKKILRDCSKGILNNKVRLFNKKMGFNASINSLIDLNKEENLEQIFDKKSSLNDIVDFKKIKKHISKNKKEIPNDVSKFIFSIITTRIFLKEI